MKCEDEFNGRTHLETLMRMQEQLAGVNSALTDDNLVTVTLSSLPKSYHPLINVIAMSVMHAKVKLEPAQVIRMLIDEFKRLAIEEHQLKASENALTAAKGCGKSQAHRGTPNTTRSDVECWKCGKKGPIKADCHSKAKKKDKREEDKKGGESANAAAEGEEFAFMMTFSGTTLVLGMSPLTE